MNNTGGSSCGSESRPVPKEQREVLQGFCGKQFPAVTTLGKKWLGATLIGIEDKGLALDFTVQTYHCNVEGKIAESLLLAFMDEAIGATLFIQGRRLISLSISANFWRAACVGDGLQITTRIIGEQGRHLCVKCEISSASGLVASATSHALGAISRAG
jgi:acyl-coenzyme A thioesterase PaaI-like protein